MVRGIASRWYFWLVNAIPTAFIAVFTWVIVTSTDLRWEWTASGLGTFVEVFSLPLKLGALWLALLAAAVALYRSELAYGQGKHAVEQATARGHMDFRSSFFRVLQEPGYDYQRLEIPHSWLFPALYPGAKTGDFALTEEFENFVIEEGGFIEVMESLQKGIFSPAGGQYYAGFYSPLVNLFLQLRNMVPLDAEVNLRWSSGERFEGDFATAVEGIAKDVSYIVGSVNAFEGWRFFNNRQRRVWRKAVDRLTTVKEQSERLSAFRKGKEWQVFQVALIAGRLDQIQTDQLTPTLPPEIGNNESLKRSLFTGLTSGPLEGVLDAEAREMLRHALELRQDEEQE